MTIQAIETKYKGYRFRSRLEARWAVFFDALGIEWEYEKEGFTNGKDFYLPDFYLPHHKVWVEVKGDKDALVNDHLRMVSYLDWGGYLPNIEESYNGMQIQGGFLILGNIPDPSQQGIHFHPLIRHNDGLLRSWITFFRPIEKNKDCVFTFEYFLSNKYVWDFDLLREIGLGYETSSDTDRNHFRAESRILKPNYYYVGVGQKAFNAIELVTNKAYEKARSARFEHGE
jgi:hypothetical protein